MQLANTPEMKIGPGGSRYYVAPPIKKKYPIGTGVIAATDAAIQYKYHIMRLQQEKVPRSQWPSFNDFLKSIGVTMQYQTSKPAPRFRKPILTRTGPTIASETRDRGALRWSGLGCMSDANGEFPRGTAGFLAWLKADAPEVYAALKLTQPDLFGDVMGNTTSTEPTGFLDRITGAIQSIAPAYFQFRMQDDVMDLQLQRAKQGLPPLDVSQYTAPPMSVRHDLNVSEDVKRQLGIGTGTIMLGIAAIGSVLAFALLRKKR